MGSHARVILLLVLTFVAGTAAGVAADRFGFLPGTRNTEVSDRDSGGGRAESRQTESDSAREGQTTIERFADEIGLSGEQRAEIDDVLERYRSSMRQIWRETRPRYGLLVDSVRTQIESLLTPEQVTQYRELLHSQRSGNSRRGNGSRGEAGGESQDETGQPQDRADDGNNGERK